MSSGGEKASPDAPLGDEDTFGDVWDQIEGPSAEPEAGDSEAFTEFAASPRDYTRGASLRRRPPEPEPEPKAPTEPPLFDVDGPEDVLDVESTADGAPGHKHTADDVRSLLDKVMEEALPTNPGVEPAAFPEDGTPTLRPSDAPAEPPRGPSTQLVDAEAAAMAYAVGAGRPDSFDAVPAALSDEVKAADKVVRGKPGEDLRHLTDDLSLDVAATAVRPEPSPTPLSRKASDPLPAFLPAEAPADPIAEPELELAFDPRRASKAARPAPGGERLLDEVTPKSSPSLIIGLAVALIGLLLVLVVKSLL